MSEHSDEFDRTLRRTLDQQARESTPPAGLADRLVANARAGRRTVTPINRFRRGSRWTAPLIAAAAIVVIAGGTVVSSQLIGQGDHDQRPAAPVSRVATDSARPTPNATVRIPRPHSTTRPPGTDIAPADFHAADVSFRDAEHGYALGVSGCPKIGDKACSVTLIATQDGGSSWYLLRPPSGLHSMFPTSGSDGSCASNGNVLGVCVDNVVFADAGHGYLYGAHAFFSSSDGGQTWHKEKPTGGSVVNVSALVTGGGYVYRVHSSASGSSGLAGRLQRRPIGGATWADASPGDIGANNSSVVVIDHSVYLAAGPYAGHESTVLYRSDNRGASWTKVMTTANGFANGLVAAPSGAVAVGISGSICSVAVSADGRSFGSSRRVEPGCANEGGLLVGATSARDLVLQVLPKTTNVNATGSTTSAIYRSDDGGGSFAKVTTLDVPANGYGQTVRFIGAFGYVLDGNGGLTVSRDGGQTWSTQPI